MQWHVGQLSILDRAAARVLSNRIGAGSLHTCIHVQYKQRESATFRTLAGVRAGVCRHHRLLLDGTRSSPVRLSLQQENKDDPPELRGNSLIAFPIMRIEFDPALCACARVRCYLTRNIEIETGPG